MMKMKEAGCVNNRPARKGANRTAPESDSSVSSKRWQNMKIYKLIAMTLCAALMLTACSKEGSSGVQDGTRWQNDAVQMVQEATR